MRYACISAVILSALSLSAVPAMAGSTGSGSAPMGHGPRATPGKTYAPSHGGAMKPVHRGPAMAAPAGFGTDRLIPPAAPATPQPQPIIVQPVIGGGFGYSYPYLRESELRPVVIEEPQRAQPVQNIFIGAPGTGDGFGQRRREARAPYAPPAIYIIGEPSTRHMRGPVHLTHGMKPRRQNRLDPKVVWLKEQPVKGGRTILKSVE